MASSPADSSPTPRTLARVLLAGLAAFVAIAAPIHAQTAPAGDTSVKRLPLIELPSRRDGAELAIFLTGDGGFAELDKQVATVLADSGIAVVALDSRAYLWRRRTPDETAADLARIARHYAAHWHRDRLLLVGYSRGADLLPFVADRLPPDVAPRVVLLAMLGLGTGASFQFHFADLFRDIQRPTDLPILPALEKLSGRPMLCVFGIDEQRSACRDADPALIARHAVPGDHHFERAYAAVGAIIAAAARR